MSSGIHIFGASGSGTTSLGAALGIRLQAKHLDTDDFYWQKTNPPFTQKESPANRIKNIKAQIDHLDKWILSGSLCSWGDPLISRFKLMIFLKLDPKIRMARLIKREQLRYGNRIKPRGDMYHQHLEFIDWARSYDTALPPVRSLVLHQQWMNRLQCAIVELDSAEPMDALVTKIAEIDSTLC